MKILQVNKFYYPKRGADRHFLELSSILEEAGHDVLSFSMEDEKNLPSRYAQYFVSHVNFDNPSSIIEKFRVLGRMLYSFEARSKIQRLLRDHPVDVMHIHNVYHQISPSILGAAKRRGIPIVQTVHDLKLMCPNYKMYTEGSVCERCFKHKYYNATLHKCIKNHRGASAFMTLEMYFHALMNFYKRHVDHFIAPSVFMHDKMVAWGFNPEKISVLPNFVDINFFKPSPITGDNFVYIGGLEPEKGIGTVLAAAKAMPEMRVVIAGAGSYENKVREYIDTHKMHDRVEYLGFVDKETGARLIAESRGMIVPSRLYENNPLSALEAFASGRPVIGSAIGGIPELIGKNERGLLFTSGDALGLAEACRQLLQDTPRAEQMGKAGRVFVESLSRDAYRAQIEAVYHSLGAGAEII